MATTLGGGTGRFVPARVFSCPNHPSGPPSVDGGYDGGGAPEVAFDVARELHGSGDDRLWVALGLCCEEHGWVDKIGEDGEPVMREVSVFEDMLRSMYQPMFPKPIVAEMLSGGEKKVAWVEDGLA